MCKISLRKYNTYDTYLTEVMSSTTLRSEVPHGSLAVYLEW